MPPLPMPTLASPDKSSAADSRELDDFYGGHLSPKAVHDKLQSMLVELESLATGSPRAMILRLRIGIGITLLLRTATAKD